MEKTLYYPTYLLDYTCKCGACRHTCCTGHDWNISMSRNEYANVTTAAHASMQLEPLVALFTPDANRAEDLVPVPLQSSGLCALLEPDGTCAWRNRSGSDICSICREFPTMYLRLFDAVYAYPSGGCEAVLEALMRANGPIELRSRPYTSDEPHAFLLDIAEDQAPRDSVYGVYPILANLGLTVLQDERYSLDERMALLMAYLDMADKMIGVGQASRLEVALNGARDERRTATLLDGFTHDARPGNPAIRTCSDLYHCCLDSPAYAPWARRILENLGFEIIVRNPRTRGTLRLRHPEILERRREEYRPYLAQKEPFLAKVMASVYLHNGIPLANPDPWSNSRYFAVCYTLIKFGIVGHFETFPSDEELVDFLVVALRAFTHNSAFYQNTVRWMDGLEFTKVGDFAKMVLW